MASTSTLRRPPSSKPCARKPARKLQSSDPVSAGLHPKGKGGPKPKGTAPTRKTKTSAAEATQGIAAARQGIEASALAGAEPPADLATPTLKATPQGPAVGARVLVGPADTLRLAMARFAGLEGTATADTGDEWEVRLDKTGRRSGVRLFLVHEIEAAAT